jgi:hypothetical protein
MSSLSKSELQARRRRATETILDSEALTDNLADPEAAQLLAWATQQAERLAEETAPLPPEERERVLDERLGALRQVVRGINTLAGRRQPADPARLQRRLERLRATAETLGLSSPDEEALTAFVREREDLEASDRLERLLRLWEGERSEKGESPEPAEPLE